MVDFNEATVKKYLCCMGNWNPEEGDLVACKFPQTGNAWKVRNTSGPLCSLDPGPTQPQPSPMNLVVEYQWGWSQDSRNYISKANHPADGDRALLLP